MAITGLANLESVPRESVPDVSEFHNSAKVAGFNARSVPAVKLNRALDDVVVAHRIAFVVPFEETDICAPGNSYVTPDTAKAVVLNVVPDRLKAYMLPAVFGR